MGKRSRWDPYLLGILYACVTSVLWGTVGILLKVASQVLGPASLVCLRALVAFSLLLPFMVYFHRSKFKFRRPPLALLIAGCCLASNYFAFIKGVALSSASNAQVLSQAGPILLVLFGTLILKEKICWQQFGGILCSILGFLLFYRDQVSTLAIDSTLYQEGVRWVLLSALFWATYAIVAKKIVGSIDPHMMNLFFHGLTTMLFLPFIDLTSLSHLALSQWLLVVFLGLYTLIAYGTLAVAFTHVPASTVGMIIAVNPMICVIVMKILQMAHVTWLNPESIHLTGYFGAALSLLGVLIVIRFSTRHLAQEAYSDS